MNFKIGDKVTVNLGEMRGQWYASPSGGKTTLDNLLPDGTTLVIASFNDSYPDWCYLDDGNMYYPVAFLLQSKTVRQKLHEAVRDIR